MFNISSFLSKFSKNIKDSGLIKEVICRSVYNHTQIEVKPENIEIKEGVLFLKISPIYKNKIFILKKDIISDISSFNIIDIR